MSTLVNPQALTAAAECAGTDKFRPQLAGVFVDGAGWVCATDGHVLLEVSPAAVDVTEYPLPDGGHGEAFNGEGIIIPLATAVAGGKMAPKRTNAPILRYVLALLRGKGEDARGELFATDMDSRKVERFRPIEGPYPNWRQVVPKGDAIVTVGLSVRNLERVLSAMRKLGVTEVRMEVRAPREAVQFTGRTAESEQVARALVMPLRLKD